MSEPACFALLNALPPRGVEGQLAPRHPPPHRPTLRDAQYTDRNRHPYEREREGAPCALALLDKRATLAEAARYGLPPRASPLPATAGVTCTGACTGGAIAFVHSAVPRRPKWCVKTAPWVELSSQPTTATRTSTSREFAIGRGSQPRPTRRRVDHVASRSLRDSSGMGG